MSKDASQNTDVDDQLVCIARIALIWNSIDETANITLEAALAVPSPMMMQVATRINGFDGKVELIKQYAAFVSDDTALLSDIGESLSFAKTAKTYRDAVVHTIPDFERGRGKTIKTQARVLRIDISRGALTNIYAHVGYVDLELVEVMDIIRALRREETSESEVVKQQAAREIADCLGQLRFLHGARKMLPRLPPLPPVRSAHQDWVTQ